MYFKYGIDTRLSFIQLVLYGVQWLAVSIPITIILGKIVAITFGQPELAILYLQKLFLITGIVLGIQVIWGHQLPLLVGPATVLVIGILASLEAGTGAINGAMMLSGGLLTLLAMTGLFAPVKRLFTPRVVTAILSLVAMTLVPTIIGLIAPRGTLYPARNYFFVITLTLLIFVAHGNLKGMWKSTITIWGAMAGSIVYILLFGLEKGLEGGLPILAMPITKPLIIIALPNFGVLISFLVCILALSINDLGSIQALGTLTEADGMERRITKGLTVTGLGNVLSGLFGIVGPVNFSLSSGVVLASECASRFALLPAAAILMLLGCSPAAIGLLSNIPLPVVAGIMIYFATAQIASGLLMGYRAKSIATVEEGLIVGLPVILGTVVAFLPQEVISQIPLTLRPILANGFVIGTLSVFLFEHLIYRKST